MATIREIKPGEDPDTVLAEMDHCTDSTDDEYDDTDDERYDGDEDEDFNMFAALTDGPNGIIGRTRTRGTTGVSCHDDDDSIDSECGHCTCDKHKKILSFMDACVKLGFQLLSSDFEKSFKPLQNAFNSSQKSTPIKQLNGVALSVKRVCNYALEQSSNGYIDKFKKFIQKEMVDTDNEHIEFLIEMHFEMKENFDCYSKNFVLLLAIANQLKPAYSEAVTYRVSSKAFKESQAIDRFLKTQEDIKNALVHYEKVLAEIKEKFDEQHKSVLDMPHTPESIRNLMNGSYWVAIEPDSRYSQHTELESSSEHIDISNFELELEQEALKNQQNAAAVAANGGKAKKSKSSEVNFNNVDSAKLERTKKSKKKARGKVESSPHEGRSGSINASNRTPNSYSKAFCISKEKLLKSVHCTTVHCERSFKVKNAFGDRKSSNNSSRERSVSSTSKSGRNQNFMKTPLVEKFKHSCQIRNFECCDGKFVSNTTFSETAEKSASSSEAVVMNEDELENFSELTNSNTHEVGFSIRLEDYLDDSDDLPIGDDSDFITVNNKRSNNKTKTQNKFGNTENNSPQTDGSKKDSLEDPVNLSAANPDHRLVGKNRAPKFDKISNTTPIPPIGTLSNGPLDANSSKSYPGSTTNTMTVAQKMQALMSSEPKPNPVTLPELAGDSFKHPEEFSKVDTVVKPADSKPGSDFDPGTSDVHISNGAVVNKLKPISKPIATVDPCKSDKPSVVTTSAKSVDKWNSAGLFTPDSALDLGNIKDPPNYQGYSPFNGSDRLRAVQDSMAQYTKSTSSTPKPNEFESSVKEPITSSSSQLVFSSGFLNGGIYPGIFSNPGSSKDHGLGGAPFSQHPPPGFDIANDLLKSAIGPPEFRGKSELSPDLDLKSNLNPTASVFNPTVANSPKDFFPSANPPISLFQRSNSTPDTPSMAKPAVSSNALVVPPLHSVPSRAKEESSSKFFPIKASSFSRTDFVRLYKEQMHLQLRVILADLNDCKTKIVFLEKLKGFTSHWEDMDIVSLVSELNSRLALLREDSDAVYCVYKHNMRLLTTYDVSTEQLFQLGDVSTRPLTAKLQRFFSTISFS